MTKTTREIRREVEEVLKRGSGRLSSREKWNLYDESGRFIDDVSAYSAEEALRLAGGPGVASARLARGDVGPTTSVTWFRFTAPGMAPVVGAVQGSGGVIRYGVDESTRKMRRQTRLARSGDRLDVYEPRRGHVRVFPDYGPGGSGRHVDVDLRRASFEVVAVPGDPIPSAGAVR